jgi:ribulose-5-phosphate 4-epimerase/fuculose-1-phosphate aldolase
VVLMRRHGATVAGTSLKELVSRSVFLCQNAEYQMKAYLLGAPAPLRPGEIKLAGSINAMPSVVARTWEYWSQRLQAGGLWPANVKAAVESAVKLVAEKKKRA